MYSAVLIYAQKNNVGDTDKYSQVKIFASGENDFKKIMEVRLLIDHAVRKSEYTDAWLSQEEIQILKNSGELIIS